MIGSRTGLDTYTGVTVPFDAAHRAVHHDVVSLGEALFAIRLNRSFYLDDHVASDGAFSIVLAMFIDTMHGFGTSIDRIVAAADVPLSTALYILDILIDTEEVRQIGPVGQECYTLTHRAEQNIYRYLSDNMPSLKRTVGKAD